MSWFSRRKNEPQDPQQLVDEMAARHGEAAGTVAPTPAIDDAGATPARDFMLTVEDVFSITGRGTVVTGVVARGELSAGQEVTQLRGGAALRTVRVTAIEMFRKAVRVAQAGDNIGVLVSGANRSEFIRGDVLVRSVP